MEEKKDRKCPKCGTQMELNLTPLSLRTRIIAITPNVFGRAIRLSSLQEGDGKYEEISGGHIRFAVVRAFTCRRSDHMGIHGYDECGQSI